MDIFERDKDSGKSKADEAQDALMVFQHTHRETTRLCVMAARQGATDAQIANVLLQSLPHHTDPDYLKDKCVAKQPEGLQAIRGDRHNRKRK